MDYKPRFYQPFTLQEAIALDVPIITEEISRLQNSLQKLGETQSVLKDEQHDPEIKKAFEENQLVIASQQERISILEMALKEKGIVRGAHYNPITSPQPPKTDQHTAPENPPPSDVADDDEDGKPISSRSIKVYRKKKEKRERTMHMFSFPFILLSLPSVRVSFSMNAGERYAVCKRLLQATELENRIQLLKASEASIQSIVTAQQLSQGDDTVKIDDYRPHLASIKKSLEQLASKKQSHLETLSKYEGLSDPVFLDASTEGILKWHNNLLTLWNDTKEAESNLRSYEIHVRDLFAKLDSLASLIHEEHHWQKPMIAFLGDLVQITRRLKNAHNMKLETANFMDVSLDLRLAQISERMDEVKRRYAGCCEEVEQVKEIIASLKTPNLAAECVRTIVATLMPTLADSFAKETRFFLAAMDEHCDSHIQKIKVATDPSQLEELLKGI